MANEVSAIRTEMCLTPGEFGAIFGVHRTTISRWESEDGPEPNEAMLRWMRQELFDFRTRKRAENPKDAAA